MSTGRHVKPGEVIAINDLLNRHLKKIGGGMVEYEDGYDDERIAKMVGSDLSHSSVAKLRLTLFGKLVQPQAVGPANTENARRIDELEQQVIETVRANNETLRAVNDNLRQLLAQKQRIDGIVEHINRLGGGMQALSERLDDLEERYNKLITTLSLKQIADVRHLQTHRQPQLPINGTPKPQPQPHR